MESSNSKPENWQAYLVILLLPLVVRLVLNARYRSPLANVPGPYFASVSRLCHAYHIFRGDNNTWTRALHERYGHFVRLAPNEVSVSHPDGPALILQAPLRKADWYRVFALPDYRYVNTPSLLDPKVKADRARLFAPAFQLSNLLRAEPHFDAVLGGLLDRLDEHAAAKSPMHLGRHLSFAALDVAGEALFSRPLGFLAAGRDLGGHLAQSTALNRYAAVAGHFWPLHVLLVANPAVTWTGLLAGGHVLRTVRAALRRRRGGGDGDGDGDKGDARFDVLAHWMRAQRENPEALSQRDVEAQVIVTVSAASDTVSCEPLFASTFAFPIPSLVIPIDVFSHPFPPTSSANIEY
ncbi:hypothetical protein PG997_015112 [Apiospora hydei]|uniref:Cytochrome P450 n=1 Tax=Apiospora hydei TaxID=1337664 RepID=A0ABR1UVQ5_9PEZI